MQNAAVEDALLRRRTRRETGPDLHAYDAARQHPRTPRLRRLPSAPRPSASLRDIARINRWFGGVATTRKLIERVASGDRAKAFFRAGSRRRIRAKYLKIARATTAAQRNHDRSHTPRSRALAPAARKPRRGRRRASASLPRRALSIWSAAASSLIILSQRELARFAQRSAPREPPRRPDQRPGPPSAASGAGLCRLPADAQLRLALRWRRVGAQSLCSGGVAADSFVRRGFRPRAWISHATFCFAWE